MSLSTTIARPYAKAIFSIAKNTNTFDEWDNILSYLSLVIEDINGIAFIKNKTITQNEKIQGLLNFLISADILNDNTKVMCNNFLKILAYYNRLLNIKNIKNLYIKYVNIELNKLDAKIELATQITNDQKNEIISCIATKFNKKVSATFEINESLLGGFLIKIEDFVLDASIAGNLISLRNKIMI